VALGLDQDVLRRSGRTEAVRPGVPRGGVAVAIEGDDVACLEVAEGDGRARMGPAIEPAVRITADADTLAALTGGAIDGPEAAARGVRIEGDRAAIERMRAILPIRRVQPAA
jgi:hypothetical protein